MDFVQVKVYNNMYFIYCPGNIYMLGKRNVTCPQRYYITAYCYFAVNSREYRGAILNIVYQQQEDPCLLRKLCGI